MKTRAEIREEVKAMQKAFPGVDAGQPHTSYPKHQPVQESLVRCIGCGDEDDIDHRGMDREEILSALHNAGWHRLAQYSAPLDWTCKDCVLK